jgi:hypothetical protein
MELNQEPVNAGVEVVAEPQEVTETVETTEKSVEQTEQTEKPQQSADDNAKYAAARREAEREAKALKEKIQRLEGLALKGGYESVDTFAEAYERQLSDYEDQQRREKLEEQGIDPDIYEQMLQNDPRMKRLSEIENQRQAEENRQKDITNFLDYFEKANGRGFDATKDKISPEVEEMISQGIPLVVAYKAVEETTTLKQQLAEMQAKMEANETNKRNNASSTGSIESGAPFSGDFISKEVFNANKGNQRWVINNLEKITKSRPKW